MAMEQSLHTLLGIILILLVSLALVSAVAILLLIELGWIVRLTARLYWRWRSSMHPLQGGNEPPALTIGTLPPPGSGAVQPGDDGGGCHRGTGS
jgi:hypothetical protein